MKLRVNHFGWLYRVITAEFIEEERERVEQSAVFLQSRLPDKRFNVLILCPSILIIIYKIYTNVYKIILAILNKGNYK